MTGTVFIDHLSRDVAKFKVGEKVQARCIMQDVSTKTTCLSMLPHIIGMSKSAEMPEIGTTFDKVKVQKLVYGESYQIKLPTGNTVAFLHKSHLPGAQKKEEENLSSSDDEKDPSKFDKKKKKKAKVVDELTQGQVVDQVRVKELNYFDGVAHLTMRTQILSSIALDYSALEIGQFVTATIDSVNEARK